MGFFDLFKKDDRTFGCIRSSRWPTVRKHFLAKNPVCQVCNSKKNLNVHHIQPFHLQPGLELEESNLITLCEGGSINCHFLFGHFCNWKNFNPEVIKYAAEWNLKLNRSGIND
jgi:hypothetical protein